MALAGRGVVSRGHQVKIHQVATLRINGAVPEIPYALLTHSLIKKCSKYFTFRISATSGN